MNLLIVITLTTKKNNANQKSELHADQHLLFLITQTCLLYTDFNYCQLHKAFDPKNIISDEQCDQGQQLYCN